MTSTSADPTRRRRWLLIGAAFAVVVAVAIAVTVCWFTSGSQSLARSRWQPPQQTLLPSMRALPVPGWKTDVATLQLPPGASIDSGDAGDERRPHALVQTTDPDVVYVLAKSPDPIAPQWWLVGIDIRDGHGAFRPVGLNKSKPAPRCFANGSAVVCIADDSGPATAWVLDGRTGAVSYTGPTDLRLTSGSTLLKPMQMGDYLLAGVDEQGVYGVGPKAETTWFVPGNGNASAASRDTALLYPPKGPRGATMISVKDGTIINQQLPDGLGLGNVAPYDGGFAAGLVTQHEAVAVQFFDPTGHVATTEPIPGGLRGSTGNLVMVSDDGTQVGVYGPNGDALLDLPDANGVRLIGTTLFVGEHGSDENDPHWQTYDMRSGAKGGSVHIDLGPRYLGTDGSVAVRAVVNPKVDQLAKAYDLETSQELWALPTKVGSLGRLYLVHDTLLQVSDDGTQLMSLVPPSS